VVQGMGEGDEGGRQGEWLHPLGGSRRHQPTLKTNRQTIETSTPGRLQDWWHWYSASRSR